MRSEGVKFMLKITKKILSFITAATLSIMLAAQASADSASSIPETPNISVSISGNFEADLDRLGSEYVKAYPQFSDGINIRIDTYKSDEGIKSRYDNDSDELLQYVCDVIDYYIDYKSSEGISTCAVTRPNSRVTNYYVTCPLVKQISPNYCGPASVYMAMEGIKYHSPSSVNSSYSGNQADIGSEMGIIGIDDGAFESDIQLFMTNHLQGKTYYYLPKSVFTQKEYVDHITKSLEEDCPVIVMIEPPFLSYYPSDYHWQSDHYVVVTRCIKENNSYTLRVNDPNYYGSICGTYTVELSDLYNHSRSIIWGGNI